VPIAHPFELEPSDSRLSVRLTRSQSSQSQLPAAAAATAHRAFPHKPLLVSSTCLDCRLVPLRDSVPAHVITPHTEQSIFFAFFTTLLTDVTTFFLSTPTQTTTTLPTTTHPSTTTARQQHNTTPLRAASSLFPRIPTLTFFRSLPATAVCNHV